VSYLASTEGKFACIVQQESNNNSRMPNMWHEHCCRPVPVFDIHYSHYMYILS
jgi:hypothetical protein